MQAYHTPHPAGISSDESPTSPVRPTRKQAEAALIEHYPQFVRLAYLILPPSLGRHRRVLTAHAIVQRALPGTSASPSGHSLIPQHQQASPSAHHWLLRRVVSAALKAAGHPRRLHAGRPGLRLPVVLGLLIFPRAGHDSELALDRELAATRADVRAAFVLRVLEGISPADVAHLLEAGTADPADALRQAEILRATVGPRAESLLHGVEFDPCTVQIRPTDLLRRRQRSAIAMIAVLAVLASFAAVVTAAWSASRAAPERSVSAAPGPQAEGYARATDPLRLVRAPAEAWADTGRVDFTAWPARGRRTRDTALLSRALDAWANGADAGDGGDAGDHGTVRVTATPDTSTRPPAEPAQLLFAGSVDGAGVVLLHHDRRLALYTEPATGTASRSLSIARADDADVTGGAAVAVSRTATHARFLLAPWIDDSALRDLLRPDGPSTALAVSRDGITGPVPGVRGACEQAPVLVLRSSRQIVEHHSFLLADLGEPAPVHLTWTPPPGTAAPARQPREATSAEGLAAWSRSACTLIALRGTGVRAVNRWQFARQLLPEGAGLATWTCARAETWRGRARVTVTLDGPDGTVTALPGPARTPTDTAMCSRFGQDIAAGTYWQAPSGARYYLAAGSRRLTALAAEGAVEATAKGPAMAVRTDAGGGVRLTGTLIDGGRLPGWGS
ncbi:hypothetical protein ACH4M4_20430 [Streptomyces sp. NPDC017254]|uniref:hypothetical protein n=1 Tax=unclassified Streptomyces TaxID=2593676 RepID=UPI00378DBBCE